MLLVVDNEDAAPFRSASAVHVRRHIASLDPRPAGPSLHKPFSESALLREVHRLVGEPVAW
jgi:hypothetical protein